MTDSTTIDYLQSRLIKYQIHECVRIQRPIKLVAALARFVNVGVFNACSTGNKSACITRVSANCRIAVTAVNYVLNIASRISVIVTFIPTISPLKQLLKS